MGERVGSAVISGHAVPLLPEAAQNLLCRVVVEAQRMSRAVSWIEAGASKNTPVRACVSSPVGRSGAKRPDPLACGHFSRRVANSLVRLGPSAPLCAWQDRCRAPRGCAAMARPGVAGIASQAASTGFGKGPVAVHRAGCGQALDDL